jgi:DNA-binding GntR family transcriptional regulator
MAIAGSAGARRIAAVRREGQPHPRAPVHDKVYQAIQEGLIGGRFVPGRSVTLRGLAEILGVSPMPVRAAVARLVAEGALAMTPTRRVSVPAMTPGRFDELVRARILLESEAAVRAMPDIDAGRLAALEAHDLRLEACLAADDASGYMEANHAFHFGIYEASPSLVLVPLIAGLWLQFGPFMRLVYERLDMTTLVDQHERALEAIRRRDAAGLRAAIEADIRDGMRIIGTAALNP